MAARDRHAQISELFLAALEIEPARRVAWLHSSCAGDDALRAEVESLLAGEALAEGVLRGDAFAGRIPLTGLLGELDARDAADEPMPQRVGRFRVLEQIGRGGMGVVYLAEQDHPARTVALKLLRSDSFSSARRRRFELEAEILGRLQHRGIAQIHEAGTADTGSGWRAFIAMELVRGRPLLEFASSRSLREKLELLRELCDAVQHAHQHGVIHRDLKPANVLVDESGQPKILDFGVARAEFDASSAATLPGEIVGTLPYMSPEQVAGGAQQVDTRCDVHALGLIAFELIAGRPPYDFEDRSWPEIARAIREDEPPKLGALERAWRGDLETIVAKALEKDRERRYASAAELGADLGRFLRDEPIAARAPTVLYQLAKFAQRRRVLVGGVAATLVAIALGIVGTTWKAVEARDQRDRALALVATNEATALREAEQRKNAQLVFTIVDRLLRLADPAKGGRNATWLDATRAVLAEVDAMTLLDTLLESRVRARVGQTLNNNGYAYEALPQLMIAAQTQQALLPPEDLERLKTEHWLAETLAACGESRAALALYEHAWHVRSAAKGERDHATLDALMDYGTLLSTVGREAESLTCLELAADTLCAELGETADSSALAFNNLGHAYSRCGLRELALSAYSVAARAYEATANASPLDVVRTQSNIAAIQLDLVSVDKAIDLLRPTVALARRTLGPDHPETLRARVTLANGLYRQSDFDTAEPELRACIASLVELPAGSAPTYIYAARTLIELLNRQGRPDEAFEILRATTQQVERFYGADHVETLNFRSECASAWMQSGDPGAAMQLQRDTLAFAERRFGKFASFTNNMRAQLGDILNRQQRFDETRALLDETAAAIDSDPRLARESNGFVHLVLGLAREVLGEKDAALASYERAHALARGALGENSSFTAQCAAQVAGCRERIAAAQ